jgi:methionine aminopeptidase
MAATFKIKNGEQVRTVLAPKASATEIDAGRLVALSSGLVVDAGAADTAVAYLVRPAVDGETTCEVTVGNDFTLEGTGDAVFAATMRGTEVDITAAQLVDVGESSTDVLKIGIAADSGTVDSTDNIEVRINKPLF